MSRDDPDSTTSPISRVENRVLPSQKLKKARTVDTEMRVNQARRSFASLVAAAEDPPLQQRASFDIDGLGQVRTTMMSNFYLNDEKAEDRLGFTVSFEYRGREIIKHRTESEVAHNALRKALYGHGLVFRSAAAATVYKIEVEPAIPGYLSVIAEKESGKVSITLKNVQRLGTVTYELGGEGFDRKVVDAMVELISQGGGDFFELVNQRGKSRPGA